MSNHRGKYDFPVRLDRLTLMNHALWSLASERLGLTDEQLADRMRELDMADGVRDNRVSPQGQRCSCGAMISSKVGRCQFCGERGNFSPFSSI